MASLERKQQFFSLVTQQRNPLIRTSAEIVSEARRSLRVQSTQRPFTPANATRELFGNNDRVKNRPPSNFSLHAHNFDDPDSRPASAIRLARLEHKPKLPVQCIDEDQFKAFPKPPAEPQEVKNHLAGTQFSLRRAGSLTLLPVERHTIVVKRLDKGQGQRHPSVEQKLRTDKTNHRGPRDARPRRAVSESRMTPLGDVSGVSPTESRSNQRTGLSSNSTAFKLHDMQHEGCGDMERWNKDRITSTREDAQSLVWNNTITSILYTLESVAAGSAAASTDRLCELCDRLLSALEGADMLGRNCKRRSAILRALFRLIDLDSARLSLHIAELCLALAVSGNNLLNICKVIFQICRSESNDVLFQRKSIIEHFLTVLTSEDVSTSGEALLYCVGALKFLSGNSSIVKLLLDNSFIAVSQELIQRLCAAEKDNFTMTGHILVQLTAALRNLVDHPDARPVFISFGLFSELCLVLCLYSQDQNICTNISRICSKLSSYPECRQALADTPDCFPLFLEVMSKHRQRQDLVVRFLFTLGNLTATVEASRQQLLECEGRTGTLLQLYDCYQRAGGATAHAQGVDDVLVKLVRVLANMCIHPAAGAALAASEACVELLLETLALRSVGESEELVVNVAATINNLSFYQAESSALTRSRLTIAKLMMKLLLSFSMDAVLAATRVFGNLSQSKDVRSVIMQTKAHRFVVTLLDSKSPEMCYSACGVLTNLAQDSLMRVRLSEEGAVAKLLDCLKDLGACDWQLAGQVCQALWNMIVGDTEALLDAKERESLLQILRTYLDEEEVLCWTGHKDRTDFHMACWKAEFLPVAQKLVTFLHHDTFKEICI